MAQRKVSVSRKLAACPDAIWAVARDFMSAWHSSVEWIRAEGQVRCFKVKGEEAIYRERLTYFSDSDRVLRYEHLEGIREVVSYHAQLRVLSDGTVEWSAEIDAPEPRVSEIAAGTQTVFEAGLDALESGAPQHITIASHPALTVIHSAAKPGPLLLCLHGIGGRANNWIPQIAATAPLIQSAAMDLRGYGGSALGPGQSRVDDYCSDILKVMSHLGKDRVVLCGLSYGSWIAASFAMRHPDKVAALVFSGGCTGMSEASAEERKSFLDTREKPITEGKTPADFAAAVVKAIAGPNASREMMQGLHDSMAQIPAATYLDAVTCFTRPEEAMDFSKIACPVLMMTGEHDRLASPAEIRSAAERIHAASPNPSVRFEVIAGAGHVCNVEAPEAFNLRLREFVEAITL